MWSVKIPHDEPRIQPTGVPFLTREYFQGALYTLLMRSGSDFPTMKIKMRLYAKHLSLKALTASVLERYLIMKPQSSVFVRRLETADKAFKSKWIS